MALTAGLVLGPPTLAAETSSWSGRVEGPAEATPKRAPAKPAAPGAPVRIIKTVPNTPGERPALAPPARIEAPSAPAATSPPSPAGASEYAKAQPVSPDA